MSLLPLGDEPLEIGIGRLGEHDTQLDQVIAALTLGVRRTLAAQAHDASGVGALGHL